MSRCQLRGWAALEADKNMHILLFFPRNHEINRDYKKGFFFIHVIDCTK